MITKFGIRCCIVVNGIVIFLNFQLIVVFRLHLYLLPVATKKFGLSQLEFLLVFISQLFYRYFDFSICLQPIIRKISVPQVEISNIVLDLAVLVLLLQKCKTKTKTKTVFILARTRSRPNKQDQDQYQDYYSIGLGLSKNSRPSIFFYMIIMYNFYYSKRRYSFRPALQSFFV